MFENIGGKLKGFAKFLFVLGFIEGIAALWFMVTEVQYIENVMTGLLAGTVLILLNWVISWILYGFGELIESTQETNRLLRTGFSEDIAQEEEKRREEVAADEKAKRELAEQLERQEAAKQARITAYWQEHAEERQALLEKRAKAANALEAGGISTAQQQELLDLISAIDLELKKER